ncbi:uncharacterized protein N7529_000483 [Penicillium soppii]|jgi:hypothetical protein|uniref:uncharacterized protein n=1 Tax=Penicillium soppii TaxID=69789 RepID=UPI002549394D|nr:uncharacterized protein N7529_000483 [Penicillium soppii]KAJ5881811.1 hypothetical protein N7529_000483 [Penicillium soppii]
MAPRKSAKGKKEKAKDLPKEKAERRSTLRPSKSKNAIASKALGHDSRKATAELNLKCADGLCVSSEL